jgi:hypothetical protein
MPVTYSFTTVLEVPTSEFFDCLDLGEVFMPSLLSIPGISATRGAPWSTFDGFNDFVMYSDDGVLNRLTMQFPLAEKHTFETTFKPSQLPHDLSDLNQYRFFVGTYDRQENASGVLLSNNGIALVAYFGSSALVLPGSQNIFTEGEDYHTLRLVVDGDTNLMHLYVTKTDDIPTTGHILRYTSASPESILGEIDSVRIEILGQGARTVRGKFSTFRISCAQAIIPNRRPIADAGSDQTANVGSAVVHDGRNSYDPEGAALTYDWKLKDAPDGSRFKSTGTGGSTLDDGDADGFTDIFNGGTDAFSVENMPLLQPGDHLLVADVFYVVGGVTTPPHSTDPWEYDSAAGRYVRKDGVWDDDLLPITTDTLPDNLSGEPYAVYHSDAYFTDRELPFPSAIPDKPGIYMVGLIVNDGELDSFESESILNVASTSVVLGCTPDVSWIWNYLSDFWNLLEDREVVETVWSGFAQACAAQLLTAWQIDYNKSLLDIQRVLQRRWLDYPSLLDETESDDALIRILRGPILSGDLQSGVDVDGKTLQLVLDADSVQTMTFVGTNPLSAVQIAQQINQEFGFIGSIDPLAKVWSKVRSGSEPLTGSVPFSVTNTLNGETIQFSVNDDIKTVTFAGSDPIDIVTIVEYFNDKAGFAVAYESDSFGIQSDGGGYLSFKITDGIFQLLDLGSSDDNDWTDLGFGSRVGDPEYLVLEYPTLLRVRPGGTANSFLGLSTTDYIQNDLQGSSGGAISATKLSAFEAVDPPILDFALEGVTTNDLLVTDQQGYRVQKVALDVASGLEKRGLTLKDALPDDTPRAWVVPSVVFTDTNNFLTSLVVAGDLARFDVKEISTGRVTEILCEVLAAQTDRVGFDPKPLLEFYAGVPSSYTTEFLGIKRNTYIPVDDLVVEIPRLQEIIKNPVTKLDQNIDFYVEKVTAGTDEVNAIRFKSGTFGLMDPAPDTFWAETTYLDNRPVIEANFGRLVNFRVEDLEDRSDDLDYLSAVRGLWWSYFGGPALSKVKTGVQILLGLPFSEVDGTIEDIESNFSATEGRITIRDKENEDVIRTYFYPLDAGLAINDDTGVVWAEGDEISQFYPLSGGVEVRDFVQTPLWMQKYVAQGHFLEVEKYFRYLIRADVDTFSMANLIFAIDFAKKLKPHYTQDLFILLKNLEPTEVDVQDDVNVVAQLSLFDTFCPIEPGSYRWDDSDESGNWNHTYDDPSPPPFLYDTHRLCPGEYLWVHISYDHPGGAGWFFDTIWAYDDGDRDGDTISDDQLPLSGPDHLPPAPYGPAVGVISYDDTVTAGTYHREREL